MPGLLLAVTSPHPAARGRQEAAGEGGAVAPGGRGGAQAPSRARPALSPHWLRRAAYVPIGCLPTRGGGALVSALSPGCLLVAVKQRK